MHDKNAQFDLGWAPVRYPGADPNQTGTWRVVAENDVGEAVMWTNGDDAAGITWIVQSPLVVEIHKHFLQCAAAGILAKDAYITAETTYATALSDAESGSLAGIGSTMNELMNDMRESM